MKRVFLPLAFLIIGIGVSYFTFNHSIVKKKLQFYNEVDSLFERNLSAQEINSKIFQLLFAYFAIDLQDIENKVTSKIIDSIQTPGAKVVEKLVERVVYLPASPLEEKVEVIEEDTRKDARKVFKSFKSLKAFESIKVSDFLKQASPILEKDKAFETLNGTHKYIGNNPQGPNFEIEIENLFKLVKKSYRGTSRVNYKVLGKDEDAIIVDGMPLNFLKNDNYPSLVAVRISKDRYILINTADEFYTNDIKGILYIKNGDVYKKDGFLRVKSKD